MIQAIKKRLLLLMLDTAEYENKQLQAGNDLITESNLKLAQQVHDLRKENLALMEHIKDITEAASHLNK